MDAKPRGRLAPSPTGALHLGNARSFLLAWLSIRSRGGTIVLRIEDLDGPRVKKGAEAMAIEELQWLGLDWDEGPDVGGPFAPYRQNERTAWYREAVDRLLARDQAYPCICTRSEIERAASAPHADEHETPYPGTCRGKFASIEQAERESGRPAAVRFLVPEGKVSFTDLFRGSCEFEPAKEVGDFVIEKVERAGPKVGLRTAAYQLAVVVDDAAMRIDEVLRGDDLLSSTARQILLQRALGLPTPAYAHVPLLVGPDGKRLAKRHGDTTIRKYREQGHSSETVLSWLAKMSKLTSAKSVNARELVSHFSLQNLPAENVCVPHLAKPSL